MKRGANPLTLAGLAGGKDLVLTCTGDLVQRGELVWVSEKEIPSTRSWKTGQVAEGVRTTQAQRI